MTEALIDVGDSYRAPDGVQYSLIDESAGLLASEDRLAPGNAVAPFVEEVPGFEELPVGSTASRRVVVRWSDGTEGEALRYYHDEVLVSGGRRARKDARAAALIALQARPRLAAVLNADRC